MGPPAPACQTVFHATSARFRTRNLRVTIEDRALGDRGEPPALFVSTDLSDALGYIDESQPFAGTLTFHLRLQRHQILRVERGRAPLSLAEAHASLAGHLPGRAGSERVPAAPAGSTQLADGWREFGRLCVALDVLAVQYSAKNFAVLSLDCLWLVDDSRPGLFEAALRAARRGR